MNILDKRPYKLTRHGYSKRKVHPMIYETAKEYDHHGYISTKLAKELQKLYDDDYEISIHRTGYTKVTPNLIQEIFDNGLINNGDAMQGVRNSFVSERTKTLTPLKDFMLLVGQIKAACNYKNSEGVFLVKIPKSYLGLKDGEIMPIWYYDGNYQRLLPEFIYGYIPVKNEVVGDIIRNNNYKDYHDYEQEGLLYEPGVKPKTSIIK